MAQGYSPHSHRGEWRGVSPEELAHGIIFAVPDAVRSEAGNTDLLNAWKRCLLSASCTSKVLASAEQRTLYALQQRENVSAVDLVVRRSCFQRYYEVARLQQRLAETVSAAVASHMVYDEYRKNFTMFPGSAGAAP